jgi:hypothetical protein
VVTEGKKKTEGRSKKGKIWNVGAGRIGGPRWRLLLCVDMKNRLEGSGNLVEGHKWGHGVEPYPSHWFACSSYQSPLHWYRSCEELLHLISPISKSSRMVSAMRTRILRRAPITGCMRLTDSSRRPGARRRWAVLKTSTVTSKVSTRFGASPPFRHTQHGR